MQLKRQEPQCQPVSTTPCRQVFPPENLAMQRIELPVVVMNNKKFARRYEATKGGIEDNERGDSDDDRKDHAEFSEQRNEKDVIF